MGCKIEDGFIDIFGVVGRHLGYAGGVFSPALTIPGTHINFAAKRRKMAGPIFMAQPSLFFPYFNFNERNGNTGIKLLISRKV